MAARIRKGVAERTRDKIRTTQLVKRMQKHALGELPEGQEMSQSQILAAKTLLDRTLPVVKEVQGSVEHNHTHTSVGQTGEFLNNVLGVEAETRH